MITSAQLQRLCPQLSFNLVALYAVQLPIACAERNVDNPRRLAAFLGQWLHESARFTRMEESLHYSPARLLQVFPRRVRDLADARALVARGPEAIANRVYSLKLGNGNEASGDGWRYRGRGVPQLTGRDNYRFFGMAVHLPLEEEPDRAAAPDVTFRLAAAYWHRRGLNALADQHTRAAYRQITRRINGPAMLGHEERVQLWLEACDVLGLDAPKEA